MRTVNGLSGPNPPPRLMGLELAPAPPGQYQQQQDHRPAPPAPPTSLTTTTTTSYPPLAPDKAATYQTAFEQLDGDRDGMVQGIDCFPALMRSGLPKEILKSIWDVVAGDEGYLNRHQFVQCLYLVDCVKGGLPVPPVLPPGQFPPTQGGIGLQSMVGRTPQSDIYTQGELYVPPMVPKSVYIAGAAPAVAFQSQVPPAPTAAQAAGLSPAEAQRLQAERDEAMRQETERQRAEEERVAAAARRDFFTQTLANLRVAQSKVARTLVEAQQRLEMEKRDAETMEQQYNVAYEAFSAEHARAAPLLEALKRVEDEKSELSNKMAALQAAIAQLEEYDPEWEAKEAAECDGLKKEITQLTVRHEALQQARAAVTAQRQTLETAIEAVKSAAERAQGGVEEVSSQVSRLSVEAKKEGATVVGLLQRLAPLYNELYDAAKAAMVPLPKEALATIARPQASAFVYDPVRFGGAGAVAMATDWDVFTDEGFTIAATVAPDPRLVSLTSSSLKKAEDGANEEEEKEEEEKEEKENVEDNGGGEEKGEVEVNGGGDENEEREEDGDSLPPPLAEEEEKEEEEEEEEDEDPMAALVKDVVARTGSKTAIVSSSFTNRGGVPAVTVEEDVGAGVAVGVGAEEDKTEEVVAPSSAD